MRLSLKNPGALAIPPVWVIGTIALTYLGLALVAARDGPLAWTVLLVVALGLDVIVERHSPVLKKVLSSSGFGASVRGLLQLLTFGLLLALHFSWSTGAIITVALLLLLMPASRSAVLMSQFAWRTRMRRPLQARNIDLAGIGSPPPRAASTAFGEIQLAWLGSAVLAVAALGVAGDVIWPFVALALSYTAALTLAAAMLIGPLLGRGGHLGTVAWEERALARIRALEPEVVLYFSGSPDSIYQVNMWLKPLADLGRPALVLLRENSLLMGLAPTNLPVVCMPDAVTVMNAKLTTARVAFYAAHTGKNIHFLREPGLCHVFIGHGDSDKVSSINPFAKVYDELWVAGPAARARWANADVGIHDSSVVEVGRPQLVSVQRSDLVPSERRTVLYAPTWEGWTDEDFGASITDMGPMLVEQLLAADPAWRVIYKPHPFTGLRDPRARRADQRIVAMLGRASTQEAIVGPNDLEDLRGRMADPSINAEEFDELARKWSRAYWALPSAQGHVVVSGSLPTLFDCFNQADVLIADVSSVVSDFLASGKPYVCANPRGLTEEAFREENPSTGAAYLLGPDCEELAEILESVRGSDPMSRQRDTLKEYLLGPAEPPSIARWRSAVTRIVAAAQAKSAQAPWVVGDPLEESVDGDIEAVADFDEDSEVPRRTD